MKKVFLLGLLAMSFAFAAHAQQISKNALGLRFGDNDGFGAEISYQRGLFSNNRLEFDLGWRDGRDNDGFKLVGLYQWVFPLDGSFHWYVGAGAGIGSVEDNNDNNDSFALIAGDIGVEYNFRIPLLLSLDFRPEFGFGDENFENDDLDFDIGIGIRYQF
jgi:hypothetical protein